MPGRLLNHLVEQATPLLNHSLEANQTRLFLYSVGTELQTLVQRAIGIDGLFRTEPDMYYNPSGSLVIKIYWSEVEKRNLVHLTFSRISIINLDNGELALSNDMALPPAVCYHNKHYRTEEFDESDGVPLCSWQEFYDIFHSKIINSTEWSHRCHQS